MEQELLNVQSTLNEIGLTDLTNFQENDETVVAQLTEDIVSFN
jgi:hypothetical protein